MTTTYTDSKGNAVEIASMAFPHLKSALAKAIRTEERRHEGDPNYENPDREAEIAAMTAEVAKRDAAYAAEQEAAGDVR